MTFQATTLVPRLESLRERMALDSSDTVIEQVKLDSPPESPSSEPEVVELRREYQYKPQPDMRYLDVSVIKKMKAPTKKKLQFRKELIHSGVRLWYYKHPVLGDYYADERMTTHTPYYQIDYLNCHFVSQHPMKLQPLMQLPFADYSFGDLVQVLRPTLRVGALTSPPQPYPNGTFNDATEYAVYVRFQISGRVTEAIQYANAGLAGGNTYAHQPRDPFPFGRCFLLLFKKDKWQTIIDENPSQEYLTKEILAKYKAHLEPERIVHFELRHATQDAHISLHKSRQQPADCCLVKVKNLAPRLESALADNLCDYEELREMFPSFPADLS